MFSFYDSNLRSLCQKSEAEEEMAVHEDAHRKKSSDAMDEIPTFNVENIQNNTRIINYRFAHYLTVLLLRGIIVIFQFQFYLKWVTPVDFIFSALLEF